MADCTLARHNHSVILTTFAATNLTELAQRDRAYADRVKSSVVSHLDGGHQLVIIDVQVKTNKEKFALVPQATASGLNAKVQSSLYLESSVELNAVNLKPPNLRIVSLRYLHYR